MLQATYKDNTYTFYVTLKDAEQYKNDSSFPVPIKSAYLVKFTNDMSADIKWAYAQNVTVNDRYTKFDIINSTTANESVNDGKVNFEPNGYWKYEIYWMYEDLKVDPSDCNLFNPIEKGTWECTNSSGTVIDSGNLDVDNYEITGLDADTYTIKEYSTCYPPPYTQVSSGINTITQTLSYNLCSSGSRELLFTKVVRNLDTSSFHIASKATVGFEIRIENAFRTYSHIITSSPESVVMEISTGNLLDDSDPYNVYLYDAAGVLSKTYNTIAAVRENATLRVVRIMASNNQWEDVNCGASVALGSIIFNWNNTGNSPNGGYITNLEAPLEIGKLLVGEPQGEEQVKYKQHEAPNDTNYIYNE